MPGLDAHVMYRQKPLSLSLSPVTLRTESSVFMKIELLSRAQPDVPRSTSLTAPNMLHAYFDEHAASRI